MTRATPSPDVGTSRDPVPRFTVTGAGLARNWLFAVGGHAVPFLVGLAAVPTIVSGLGTERFGLLALTWSLISAFAVFDLGLGRAVTRFVAEALGEGHSRQVPSLIWPAALGQMVLGAVGTGVMLALAPPLVTRLLNVDPRLHREAILALQVLGLHLPVVLLSLSFQGVLEALQRFDVVSILRTVLGTAVFAVPLVGASLGWDLPRILLVLLAVRAGVLALLIAICMRLLSTVMSGAPAHARSLRPVLRFAAWVSASSLVGFILTPLDRLVIGGVLSMAAVAYYAVPRELITRLGVVTDSLAMVLFPALSALSAAQDAQRLRLLFARSTKYAVLVAGPAFGLLAVLAPDILRLWLGSVFAEQGAPVLRILVVGVQCQILAMAAFVALHGLGRSDLTGKFHLVEAPLYLGGMWWLVRVYGVSGVALAWSARMALDALLLLRATRRLGVWTWADAAATVRQAVVPVATFCTLAALCSALTVPLLFRVVLIVALGGAFAGWAWRGALDPGERRWVLGLLAVKVGQRA